MPFLLVGKGTLLNTATVVAGSLLGLLIGSRVPASLQSSVMAALGLVVALLGIRLALQTKRFMAMAGAMALGGMAGSLLGIHFGIEQFGLHVQSLMKAEAGGGFAEGLVAASLLFCVGPMTLMGCLQEAIEGKIELIGIKSILDGVAALFLTVAFGPGVLLSAAVVLIVQGSVTLAGSRLEAFAKNEEMVRETEAVGGLILMGIALRLLELKAVPIGDFLPALILTPAALAIVQRRQKSQNSAGTAKSERDVNSSSAKAEF
jgi:uncharacterized membrane protein YqgA involved in biofilm formation